MFDIMHFIILNLPLLYVKKICPILYCLLLYEMGLDFLDIQHEAIYIYINYFGLKTN